MLSVESLPIIDCNVRPLVPNNLWLPHGGHRQNGLIRWDKEAQGKALLLPNGKTVLQILEEFTSYPFHNANVFDHILRNPEDLPKEYEGKIVLFLATIYEYLIAGSNSCVRGRLPNSSQVYSIGLEDPLWNEHHFVIALDATRLQSPLP